MNAWFLATLMLLPAQTQESANSKPTTSDSTNGEAQAETARPDVFDLPRIQEAFARSQAQLAIQFAQKDYAGAEATARQALTLVPHAGPTHYNLACALAQQNEIEEALDSLERAVELGFNAVQQLKQDKDLDRLRDSERFTALLERATEQKGPATNPWQYQVAPAPVVDGVATVRQSNTAWDPRLSAFRTLFLFDPQTPEVAEVIKGHGEVGDLLRRWYAEGTAAGNYGDLYDNHDRDHSNMAYQQFPLLTRIEFSDDAKKRQLDHGLQLSFFYSSVTLGNSSTAHVGGPFWRSQPRVAFTNARSAVLLYAQYVGGHLYFYPEHRDHDPGHNGKGGYGDVYPANTPYVIISQGSSGTDRPFMDAVACTLAAFRPEVKKHLAKSGTLMPTVQMIFRSCNKNLTSPEDYLTGRAHPSVFRSEDIDALAMVKLAQEMTVDATPPVIQLKVVEEDQAAVGRDYFDAAAGREKLFDTPAAIARVHRTAKQFRRMVVSAEASRDLQGLPLKWHWRVLRGDESEIRINPLNSAGSIVELLIPFAPRRPISPGSDMESNRTDIGAFVHNGVYYSLAGFVTVYSLDSEKRVYDERGDIQDIWYGLDDNYTDPLLDFSKKWWDHYQYDDQRTLIGWTRYASGRKQEFTADGSVVTKRDELKRPLEARTVRYVAKPEAGKRPMLEQVQGNEVVRYRYASDDDRVGSIVSREIVSP